MGLCHVIPWKTYKRKWLQRWWLQPWPPIINSQLKEAAVSTGGRWDDSAVRAEWPEALVKVEVEMETSSSHGELELGFVGCSWPRSWSSMEVVHAARKGGVDQQPERSVLQLVLCKFHMLGADGNGDGALSVSGQVIYAHTHTHTHAYVRTYTWWNLFLTF